MKEPLTPRAHTYKDVSLEAVLNFEIFWLGCRPLSEARRQLGYQQVTPQDLEQERLRIHRNFVEAQRVRERLVQSGV